MRALASTDCGRRVEPVIVRRLTMTCGEVELDLGAAAVGDHHQAAVRRQGAHARAR